MTSFIDKVKKNFDIKLHIIQLGGESPSINNEIAQKIIDIDDLLCNPDLPQCPVIRSGYVMALKEVNDILEK